MDVDIILPKRIVYNMFPYYYTLYCGAILKFWPRNTKRLAHQPITIIYKRGHQTIQKYQ